MAIKKKSGRQDILFGRIEFDFNDIADTTFHGAIELPHGARVVGGAFFVTAAAQAGVTVDIGDSVSGNRYGNDIAATAADRTAITLTGYKTPSDSDIGVTFSAKPTQGSFALEVQYVVDGRVAMSQGLDYRGPNIRGA